VGRVGRRGLQWPRGRPAFAGVRFGNVFGSSVRGIPVFRKQIARGGPVTVTHAEMTRYFMTIPEAVQLVIQAGAIGGRGQVYVLDMGEPVKIVDLADTMIRLSGKEPGVDVAIEIVGPRPGEKLHEELWSATETVTPSATEANRAFLASLFGNLGDVLRQDSRPLDTLRLAHSTAGGLNEQVFDTFVRGGGPQALRDGLDSVLRRISAPTPGHG